MARTAAKPPKSELSLHMRVAGLLKTMLAEPAWFTTFPAGAAPTEMRNKINASIGLRKGVPDILIVHQGIAHWLELKMPGKGRLSTAQTETHLALVAAGCKVATCESFEQVKATLDEWRIPRRSQSRSSEMFATAVKGEFAAPA